MFVCLCTLRLHNSTNSNQVRKSVQLQGIFREYALGEGSRTRVQGNECYCRSNQVFPSGSIVYFNSYIHFLSQMHGKNCIEMGLRCLISMQFFPCIWLSPGVEVVIAVTCIFLTGDGFSC